MHREYDPTFGARRVLWFSRVVVALMTLALAGLLARVVQLQTAPPAPIAKLVGSQSSVKPLYGRRGSLLDRHGRVLAGSSLAARLFVDPRMIQDPSSFAEHVGFNLGYEPGWIARQLERRPNSRYLVLDHDLDEQHLPDAAGLRLSGLGTQRWVQRQYPHGPLAGQVLGAVGFEGRGLEGMELLFGEALTGTPGRLTYLRDARRRALWIDRQDYQPPVDGQDVRLSLDLTIQTIAEKHLAAACRKYGAAHGQMLVMDPRTGEILAMANYPVFDPNLLGQSTPDQRRNRCVTDVFEPGSIFKPFIWSLATEMGLARPTEMLDCTTSGLWVSPQGRRLRDAHAHGKISWEQVLILSSNIGMAQVGVRMGPQRMYAAVKAFGFGQPSGSRLPGESPGIVNAPRKWNHYSVTSVPMGQEIAASPLQLVRAFSVFAGDGLLPLPTIRAVDRSPRGQVTPLVQQVLSPAMARETRQVLHRVTTEGTGRLGRSKLYSMFGKTGTAQVADRQRGGYLEGQYVGSFLAGAPLEDPRIVVGCFIHRPDKSKGYYGGTISAPAVREVIDETLMYLGLPPDLDQTPPPTPRLVRH